VTIRDPSLLGNSSWPVTVHRSPCCALLTLAVVKREPVGRLGDSEAKVRAHLTGQL
jgi:hypothetical protein